jgi:hypothetical protein
MREARNRLLKTQQYYLNRSSGYCIFLQSRFGFDTIFFKVGLDLVCNYVKVGLVLIPIFVKVGLDLMQFSSKVGLVLIPIFVKVGLDLMQFSSKVGLDLKIMCIFVLDIKVFRYV